MSRDIVIVDSREFSCMTPIHLYEKGFWLVPMVLTVGDYVLSDDICVERKSVTTGDLFESFKSGRLLTQITNMCRFYKKPILLIEFDESVPFKLYDGQNESAMGGDVNPQSIISKISLLALHFPLLMIMWSKGPSHTAELFKELRKQTSGFLGGISVKDPDLSKIAKIGTVGEAGDDETEEDQRDDSDYFKKYLPLEFLKKLPGVDSNSVAKIIRSV
jgi:DNA excision repair protein ERCC-4